MEIEMKTKMLVSTIGVLLSGWSLNSYAINNAPADADTITLRTSCLENKNGVSTEIPNCFETMNAVNTWLLNVRQSSATKPTVIDVGPGKFSGWSACTSPNVTLRGSGREQTIFKKATNFNVAIQIQNGCDNLNVQDMTFDNSNGTWGVFVHETFTGKTSWTNVEIIGGAYGWIESIPTTCSNHNGRHSFFSSRITSTGTDPGFSTLSRAYTASCAQSWFWGSEITSKTPDNKASSYALEANDAEVHLYGSNVRLLLSNDTIASGYGPYGNGDFLLAALNGSAIHIHGTGLDVVHPGAGTADMLYADSASHFHANESGFNIHVSGAGKVRRIAGAPNRIEAPYIWKQGTQPPLSTKLDGTATYYGVQTLISVSGADSYIETDCPVTGNCSLGGSFPHQMIYRAECTNTTANGGPWFDLTTKDCRK